MAKVILPSALAQRAGGAREVEVEGSTAGAALRRVEELHPDLRGWVLDERGEVREHVTLFVGGERAGKETPMADGGPLHVVAAISGGSPRGDGTELLVGTKKGLIVLRGPRGGALEIQGRHFPGQVAEYACRDPRTGRTFASVTHGQYGPRLFYADDPDGEWTQADGPTFPEDAGAAVSRIWIVEPGVADGELWAGVAPAALFHSTDGGASWELVRSLWDVPSRPQWEPGAGGLALHSICPWPGDRSRLAVGISAAGVWITDDGAGSWHRGVRGLVPRYLPEEAREDAVMLCVHDMQRSPVEPETLYIQFHGGVYRSDDAGRNWTEISAGLPADFGFPMVVDPRDPGRAFVIPLIADHDRVTPDGRLRVYETRDRGDSWRPLSEGLPQEDAYLTILRQAFCHDNADPLGLYFGATSGELFGSADGGASWTTLARRLPPVLSVRAG